EAKKVVAIVREASGSKAILVRNRAHLDEIVPALKEAGVRFRALDIEQLGEKQVVQDLYALTRALLHLGDRIAWLACLRAPWCGLTLADLLALSSGRSEEGGSEYTSGGALILDQMRDVTDLAALEDKIDRRLYAQPDVQAPKDAVEIMTIHRAKGLEFDTVIVPGLDRLPRSGPKPLLVWKSLLPSGLLLAPIDETGAGEDPTYKYVRELDKEADDIESGRLFYVAATRAKQRLHLLACAKADQDLRPKEPAKRSLLAKIWWQAREHFGEAPADAIAEPERMPIHDVLHRLPAGFPLPKAPASVKWT